MRSWCVLLLFGLAVASGLVTSPASARPCPLHEHGAAPLPGGKVAARDAGVAAEVTAAASRGRYVMVAAMPIGGSRHVVPDGQPCCHVAPAVAASRVPAVGPRRAMSQAAVPRSWLPPWTAPARGIFRPPVVA